MSNVPFLPDEDVMFFVFHRSDLLKKSELASYLLTEDIGKSPKFRRFYDKRDFKSLNEFEKRAFFKNAEEKAKQFISNKKKIPNSFLMTDWYDLGEYNFSKGYFPIKYSGCSGCDDHKYVWSSDAPSKNAIPGVPGGVYWWWGSHTIENLKQLYIKESYAAALLDELRLDLLSNTNFDDCKLFGSDICRKISVNYLVSATRISESKSRDCVRGRRCIFIGFEVESRYIAKSAYGFREKTKNNTIENLRSELRVDGKLR